jgi:hypothetical protein
MNRELRVGATSYGTSGRKPCGFKMDFDIERLDASRGCNPRSIDHIWAWLQSLESSQRENSIHGP